MNEARSRPVLALVDFSPCSEAAIRTAARIASSRGVGFSVLHVIDPLVVRDLSDALQEPIEVFCEQARADAERAARELVARVAAGAVDVHVTSGSLVHEVRRVAKALDAQLLVMGAYGSGGPGHGVGTLASQCVRRAGVDVLLVPEGAERFERVVACVDFSEMSTHVFERADRIAGEERARLAALYVFDAPWQHLHYRAPTPQADPDFKRQYLQHLEARLLAAAEGAGVREVAPHLRPSSRHGAGIVEFAREHEVDLVVIGTKGRTNLRYMLLGSTAERVIREVQCAVLAVVPPDARKGTKS